MTKLTFRLGDSEVGKKTMGELFLRDAPLLVSRLFDPPSESFDVVEDTSYDLKMTRMVVNAPDDSLFKNGRLNRFTGTGEELLLLGYQLQPGAAYLYRNDQTTAAVEAVGHLIGGFITDDTLSNINGQLQKPSEHLKNGTVDQVSDINALVGALLKTRSIADQWEPFASKNVDPNTQKAFPVVKMFTVGLSILVKLIDDERADLDTGVGVAKDFLDSIEVMNDAVQLVRGQTVRASTQNVGELSFKWEAHPQGKFSTVAEFAGPAGDVLDVVLSVKAAISAYGSGSTKAGVVHTISGIGGVMVLTSSIASIGATAGLVLPWLFAAGVALGIIATIAGFSLGSGPIVDWLEHTFFGSKYGRGTSHPSSLFYRYDYEYEDPDRKFAHQVSGYFWLTMPIADSTRTSSGLVVPDRLAEATIKEESAHSASSHTGTVTAGVIELPAIGGGSERSEMFIKPMVKVSGTRATQAEIMDGYLGLTGPLLHEFTLGSSPAATGPDNDPDEGMVEVPLGTSNVASIAHWNYVQTNVDGEITSYKLRLESDASDAKDVFGFSKKELERIDSPYLVVQHLPPELKDLIEGHLSDVGVNLDLNERSKLYEEMPVFPTARIPITNEL